ncbi:hypothetical protein [Suipraeoptans intestinalis]|uniref:hypothetical protein n=1 Tax=Suipraeoptans intestinalis TaxID=2606628 RepID=UPI001F3B4720|nr:hypothetical protein [Suipraeoptans intestinalis]
MDLISDRPICFRRFSLYPVEEAVRSNTFATEVPRTPGYREGMPQIRSATIRPDGWQEKPGR